MVSAINAKEIKVTFNKAVDKAVAEDVTGYSIKAAGVAVVPLTTSVAGTATNDAKAKLSEDGKTLTITLYNPLTNGAWGSITEGDSFNFNYDLKTNLGAPVVKGTNVVTFSDKVAPTFVSATSKAKDNTRVIGLEFSEPVDSSAAAVSIDGKYATLTNGTKLNEVNATFGFDLVAGQTYTVTILNIKDSAGNLITPNPVTTTVTIEADAVAPVITSVNVVRDNLLEVTFDKSMKASTVAAGLKVTDQNLTGSYISAPTDVTAKKNTDNKTFEVKLTGTPFSVNDKFAGVLAIPNSVEDSAGNKIVATTKAFTLTKDTVAPTVVSSSYKKVPTYNGTNTPQGVIVVKFSEEVSTLNLTGATVVTDQGATIAIGTAFTAVGAGATNAKVNPNDKTEIILPLSQALTPAVKSYTVILPKGAVKDVSSQTNDNTAANLVVDVSAGAPVASDTQAPTVSIAVPGTDVVAATNLTSGSTIKLTFVEPGGSGLDLASVQNINNYRLDGQPLPSGSYVTISGLAATINIPANSIAKDKTYALNVTGVKDKAGNVIDPTALSATLQDDIAPEMTSATLNSNGTVSIGFNEDMIAVPGSAEADFEVTLNGSILTDSSAFAYTLADGTGSEAGKYIMTVNTIIESGATDSSGEYTDVNGKVWSGFTASLTDELEVVYIDVDGDTSLSAGDIVVSVTEKASTVSAGTGTYNLNNATSLKIKTEAIPAAIKDDSIIGHLLKANKTIVVK